MSSASTGEMPDTAVATVAAPGPATAQQAGSGIGSLLRDPDHYEEINVIGNGKSVNPTVDSRPGYFVWGFLHGCSRRTLARPPISGDMNWTEVNKSFAGKSIGMFDEK